MKQFKKDFKFARENKLDKRFANSIIDNSIILTKEIIFDSNKHIKILSTSFNEYFYSNLKEDIEIFLAKDEALIELIVAKKSENNQLIKYFSEKFTNKFVVKFIEHSNFPKDNDTKEYVNYIVNDNNAFRYEFSTKKIHSGYINAIANFNNAKDSEQLNIYFDKLKTI